MTNKTKERGIEEAIKLAIQGGYDPEWNINLRDEFPELYDRALLDPLFWSSLSKSLGWQPLGWMDIEYILPDCTPTVKNAAQWQYEMHRFIDWIVEGKDTDSFFKQLLNR